MNAHAHAFTADRPYQDASAAALFHELACRFPNATKTLGTIRIIECFRHGDDETALLADDLRTEAARYADAIEGESEYRPD